ncbi:MAG: hypothetical protein F4Y44_02835 [Chloroflexi bacterium]|nr:hypothetical protein [Chloroflexota bacterium]
MILDLVQFINIGLAGVLLMWFMFRLERMLVRLDKTLYLMARATLRMLDRQDVDMAKDLSKEMYRVSGDRED